MKQYWLNSKAHQLPQAWSEVNDKQVLQLAPYLHTDVSTPAARLAVLCILQPHLTQKVLRRMSPEDVLALARLTEWVWSAPMDTCPVTEFEHKSVRYLLPEPVFESSSAIEYLMADHHFRQFARKQPVAGALEQLLATLCRPEKKDLDVLDPEWDGDRRQKYNAKVVELRAKELATLPVATKIVVLQYYVASQRAFHARYKELYKQQNRNEKKSGADFGLLGVVHDVAREGLFGDFERTCLINVHTLFFHLLKTHREAKEARRES
ncbi:MAG TPA: hypothetical protein VF598_03965 [Hymenobacter sp.]|jgi:hypothetical protein